MLKSTAHWLVNGKRGKGTSWDVVALAAYLLLVVPFIQTLSQYWGK